MIDITDIQLVFNFQKIFFKGFSWLSLNLNAFIENV